MTISRLTLPENFYDVTSSMLLLQPQPQFLFASLFKRAMAASLEMPMSLGLNGRAIESQGAQYVSANVGRRVIANDLFDGLFAARFVMNGQPGHTVRVNRPKFALTTYTKAVRALVTGASISTTPINIGSEQNDITIKTYLGPYDQANSRVAPYGLDQLDASMGVHSMVQLAGVHLQEDFDRTFENFMITLGNSASTTIRPAGMTADNDATVAGQFPMDYDTLNRAELSADNANIPAFADGYRLCVLTPTQLAQLKNDPQYLRMSEFHQEYNALFPGYVRSINNMHIFKCTTLSTSNNGSSIPIHKGMLMGPGTFMGAMGGKPVVRASTDDNYALTAKVIWSAFAEVELADSRFVTSIRTTGNA